MMYSHRRFWLLLSAVLLIKYAEGQDATYHPTQPGVEDLSSSVVTMGSSSVVSEQDLKFSEDDIQSDWALSSQQGFSDFLTAESESPGSFRSVLQSDQMFPGAVPDAQFLGSSYVETWSSEPNGALETPNLSSSHFEQGELYQGSVSLDSVSRAQGFPNLNPGVWVPREMVQSGPSHHGGYMVPSSGQSTRPPYRGPSHPRPQSPHRGLPLRRRPLSKPPAFLPQTKLSLSSLASESFSVGSARDPQQSSRRHPPWVPGKWQQSSPHSEMWGSGGPASYQFNSGNARRKHRFPGRLYSRDMHKGKPSRRYHPWERSSQSQIRPPLATSLGNMDIKGTRFLDVHIPRICAKASPPARTTLQDRLPNPSCGVPV
ncbi:uncharacterized protein LOC143488957 [Brachyhypopomus gauderio]|uniref:uncharacterized protein LOC143488957 n=1 Tax=Brachyhypopomus gauderio TaxID=698409 RepID=UPI0040428E56